jgi:GH35 family endo-1,4-beta-xylanase
MAFINFDRLVKIEYKNHKEEWIRDGKPRGFYWRPPELAWFAISSSLAMHNLTLKWLFKTPQWTANDLEAKECLRKLRQYVFLFYGGLIVWLFIVILIVNLMPAQ